MFSKLKSIKIREQIILIALLSILLPLLIIAFLIYAQLNKIEMTMQKDAENSLISQMNSFLISEAKTNANNIDNYLEEINNKTYHLSQIVEEVIQYPQKYISKDISNLKIELKRDEQGRYLSSEKDKANIFIPNYVQIDDELKVIIDATSYLDDIFLMTYKTQRDITAVYFALLDYPYIRMYPNRMQSKIIPADFRFGDSIFLKSIKGKRIEEVKSIWTFPYEDPGGAGLVVTCLAGIFDNNSKFKGVVGIDVAIENFIKKFLSNYRYKKDMISLITDAKGRLIATNDTNIPVIDNKGVLKEKLLKSINEGLLNNKSGIFSADLGSEKRIFSYSKINTSDWRFIISASNNEIDKLVNQIALRTHNKFRSIKIIWIVSVIFLFYLCISAMIKLSDKIALPIKKVAEAANTVERGLIPEELHIERNDEIGILAKSINNLVKTLVQRQKDVNNIQRFLRSIILNSPDMIIVADANQKIIEFNRAAELILSYDKKDIIGMDLSLIFYDEEEYAYLIDNLEKENKIYGKEVVMLTHLGEQKEISLSVAEIKDEITGRKEFIYIGKDITEKKEKERELVKRVRQLEILHKTIFASTFILNIDELLKSMAKTIQEAFQYHNVEIYKVNKENSEAVLVGKAGPYKYLLPNNHRVKFSKGIIGLVARTGESYLCQDIKDDPYFSPGCIPFANSELCVPIKSGDDIFGVVNIEETKPNAFDAQDVLTIEAIATGIYTIIKNIELYEGLKKRIDELTVFYEFSKSLMSTLNLEELLERILQVLEKTFNFRNCAIFRFVEGENVLKPWRFYGYPEQFKEIKVPLGKGITGWAAEERRTIVIKDVTKEPRYICSLPDIKSEIAIPLMIGDRLIGILDVESEYYDFFKEDEINMLTSLATQIAITIDNASLYEKLEAAHKKLKDSFVGILKALTAAVEAKDSYIDGHVQRTSMYAELVAKELNLSENMIEIVKYASILHDIGKIGIPESILMKPTKLTPEERKIMQKHPEIGVNIIKDIEFLKDAIPAILHHQERYDGKSNGDFPGYPAGLKGDDIPIAAHIIAVVDAYDAMTTNRPYRKAMSKEEAIKILIEEKGKQFHPDVVDAFIRILSERR